MFVVAVTALVELLRWFERGDGPVTLPLGSQELGLGVIMALILIFRPGGLAAGRELRLPFRRTVNGPKRQVPPLSVRS